MTIQRCAIPNIITTSSMGLFPTEWWYSNGCYFQHLIYWWKTAFMIQPRVTICNIVWLSWIPWSMCKMGVQVIERRPMPLYTYLLPSLQTWNWDLPYHPAYIPTWLLFIFICSDHKWRQQEADDLQIIMRWMRWCMHDWLYTQAKKPLNVL
jgi:hypothetical protein